MTPHSNKRLETDDFEDFSHEDFEEELFRSLDEEPSHNTSRSSNYLIIGILIAVIAAVAFLFFDGFASETYFYTVDEAVARGQSLAGETIRVKGVVEPGSIIGKEGELGRVFRITEKGKTLKVAYNRAMPDTFKEDVEVVVHGTVNNDMVLQADEVMVKCPSRYEGQPPSAHPSNIPMKSQ